MLDRPPLPPWRLPGIRALLGVVALSACRDQAPVPDGPQLEETTLSREAQVSNLSALTAASGIRATILPVQGREDLVYVSLPAGMVAGGVSAEVRRKGDEAPVITKMQDGGFDPVAVVAGAGDSIQIVVKAASGQVRLAMMVVVPLRRPPRVVRTWPLRGKPDMPVNSSMVAVFSEPLDRATVTSGSVRLFAGQRQIPGQTRVLDDGMSVAFTPDEPLAPERGYRLVLGKAIADLDGEALGEDVVVGFQTGTGTLGTPASIVVSPDSLVLLVGATYQYSAKVFDANGNLLLQPVTWQTSTPDVMSVSPTGLVTAQQSPFVDRLEWGIGRLEASVGTLAGSAFIVVVPKPERIELLPPAATISVGDTLALEAVAWATRVGRFLLPLTVTNSNEAAASVSSPDWGALPVSPFRTVKALAPGEAHITVRAGGMSATFALTITLQPAVDSVRVAPASMEMAAQESRTLTAWLRDANGRLIQNTSGVSWSSSNTSVATVNGSGKVTAVANGSAMITAMIQGRTGSASVSVNTQPLAPTFIDIASRYFGACGVTAAGDAYCWGLTYVGSQPRQLRVPTLLPGGLDMATVTPGSGLSGVGPWLCGRTSSGDAFCWSNYGTTPNRFAQTLTFSDLKMSESGYGCGVATDGNSYCWGENASGQLGDGTTQSRAEISTAVIGGHAFKSVVVGRFHSCGLTAAGEAYCWGANTPPPSYGGTYVTLGTGDTTTAVIPTPSPVAGRLVFAQLAAAMRHTCGITVDGEAYCWGSNMYGELGDGTQTNRSVPVAVATSLRFTAISVDASHTCAISTSGAAYCWGNNTSGALGVDTAELMSCGNVRFGCSRTPVAVQGSLRFVRISVGLSFSCGVATTGRLYCWGANGAGQLGDGSTMDRSTPMPVARP
jgi:alpha-tubulin suppressor-like RCC1 family protein